ncbi:hypothetical protein FA13DRAFT_1730491 [Coprinellus micaceus]|uniref:DUF7918 domain-containing protein n=1 Tax=Coprinellus micaceus TaxID=71717 RepID=A0A4Y7TH15_COPMI|nr:hypothetical protein FA13DRAFT_1730491 [Coprinellus micaceus]
MPQIGGLEVWVEMEGARLEEFGIERDDTSNTVTCWIPCQEGKAFRLGMVPQLPRVHNYTLSLDFDGTRLDGVPHRLIPKDVECSFLKPHYIEGLRDTSNACSFQFGQVKLTDDDAFLDHENLNLGEVKLKVFSYDSMVRRAVPRKSKPITSLGERVVHERTKKGLSSSASLGAVTLVSGGDRGPAYLTKKYAGLKRLGNVVFKYRSRDILLAKGIMPSAPQAAPRQGGADRIKQEESVVLEDSDSDDVDAELSQLKTRMDFLQSKKRKKSSRNSSLTQSTKKVKMEPKAEPFAPGEVIDLT